MGLTHPKELLLSPHLDPQQVADLLTPFRFQEIKKADANLQLMADEPRVRQLLSEIIEELLRCLSRSPDPDQALTFFERFARASYNKIQLYTYLKASPYTLWLLAKLFGSSPFLSEILIRNPNYLYWIADPQTLEKKRSKATLATEFLKTLKALKTKERKLEILCLLRRKELLRIGVRDLLKKSSVEETTASLSVLAEVIIQKVYEICTTSMRKKYGVPLRRTVLAKKRKAAFAILGMGKLGGGELNFSSDIDILYLYDSEEGRTSGIRSGNQNSRISNTEYFKRLSQEMTSALTGMTDEGYLYRVDLRLRPEGSSGQIAYPMGGYLKYYESRGETWERLALLKAWPVAGDLALGRQFVGKVARFIYGQPFTVSDLEQVGAIKGRINRKMLAQGEMELNVKLGIGGIREIEFIVQSLQIFFGSKITRIRERNTMAALKKLLLEGILTPQAYRQLTDAYLFLRNVEHRLQMVHELQTHRLPADSAGLKDCALRLDYRESEGISAVDQFLMNFRSHTGQVNHIFRDLFSAPQNSSLLQGALKRGRQVFSKRLAKN